MQPDRSVLPVQREDLEQVRDREVRHGAGEERVAPGGLRALQRGAPLEEALDP